MSLETRPPIILILDKEDADVPRFRCQEERLIVAYLSRLRRILNPIDLHIYPRYLTKLSQ